MNITDCSKILLIQALEESDLHGRHLPLSTRHHATQQARAQHSPSSDHSASHSETFLAKRTEIIWTFLHKAFPRLVQSWNQLHIDIPTFLVAIPALGAGLLINGLGESQRVNLLNFPLLILLLWNAAIYASSALRPFLTSSLATTWLDTAALWLAKVGGLWGTRSWPLATLSDPSKTSWIQDASKRFMTLWWPHIRPVWTQRLRQLLHIGAAYMAVGIILGLYIRGLALDYQATWESTFLSGNQVHLLLHILLGPAAWILQYPFPTLSEIMNLKAPQHGTAAHWIHMWAITALVMIVIPRVIMAWLCQRSVTRAHQTCTLPLQDPYFLHLLAPEKGQGMAVDVIPYSYQPSEEAKAFLNLGLSDLCGNLATIRWQPAVPFGQEFSSLSEDSTVTRTVVLIFNAGQTPEGEVQGEWLHTIQTHVSPTNPGTKLLVLLDEESYSRNIDEIRVEERRQTWQRFGNQYHLSLVPFNPSITSQTQFLQQAQTRLWPGAS